MEMIESKGRSGPSVTSTLNRIHDRHCEFVDGCCVQQPLGGLARIDDAPETLQYARHAQLGKSRRGGVGERLRLRSAYESSYDSGCVGYWGVSTWTSSANSCRGSLGGIWAILRYAALKQCSDGKCGNAGRAVARGEKLFFFRIVGNKIANGPRSAIFHTAEV